MNVQSHLFVLAYLPAALILWRVLNRWAGNSAARAALLCAGAPPGRCWCWRGRAR